MHNGIPLTKEHQMVLGAGEAKPTSTNPRGYSKRQLSFLNFLREKDGKMTNQSNDDGHFSSWGNEQNSFRGSEINYKDGFNLNMFQPAGEGTPSSSSRRVIIDESTLMRKAVKDMKRIADVDRVTDVAVQFNREHLNLDLTQLRR